MGLALTVEEEEEEEALPIYAVPDAIAGDYRPAYLPPIREALYANWDLKSTTSFSSEL